MLAAVLIPVFTLVALISWAFASPIGASPDDDYHMASIWCGQGIREGLCEEAAQADQRRVPAVIVAAAGCFAFDDEQSASCPRPPADELEATKRVDFNGSYPPVFYATMSVFASTNADASILVMRIANALLFVGLLTALAVLLPQRLRRAAVLPMAVTAVPLGMFIVPSVNPSSWALVSAAGVWVAVVGFVQADEQKRRVALGVLAIVFTVMGAGARGDSAAYAGLSVLIALILTFDRSPGWFRGLALGVVIAIITVVAFLTSGQSSAVAVDDKSPISLQLIIDNLQLLPVLWVGALGSWNLGWLDTVMPPIVWTGTFAVFVGFVFSGLRRMSTRKAVALALVAAALVAVPMYILVNEGSYVGEGVQPRYTYPLLVILAGIAVWNRMAVVPRFSRVQLVLIAILPIISNAVALHVNIRRYVTGSEIGGYNLETEPEWWWPWLGFGPNWVWLAGSLAFAAAMALIVWWSAQLDRRPTSDVAVV
jgi:hypothetical protein